MAISCFRLVRKISLYFIFSVSDSSISSTVNSFKYVIRGQYEFWRHFKMNWVEENDLQKYRKSKNRKQKNREGTR